MPHAPVPHAPMLMVNALQWLEVPKNQVEFLANFSNSNVQSILRQPHSKKGMGIRVEIILLLQRKCYVIITNLAISLVLTTFGD